MYVTLLSPKGLDRFSTIGARLLWCAKGFCDVAAPATMVFGAMGGIDKLRELKGLQPVFLPFLADLLIPDNEATKAYKERREAMEELKGNDLKRKSNIEEYGICKDLLARNIINETEHADWRNHLAAGNSFLDQQDDVLKQKIKASYEDMESNIKK